MGIKILSTDISKMYVYVYETVHVTGVTLNQSYIVLDTVGQTEQLTATITPANADDQTVVWSTSDSTVATVSQNGLVTCVSPGDATITVTTNDGGYTATCGVTDQQGWQPTANTICYFPLDTDLVDIANNYTLTGSNGAVIGNLNGVSCLDLTASNSYALGVISGIPQGSNARTNMLWVYGNASGQKPGYQYGTSGFNKADVLYNTNPISWSQYGASMGSNIYAQGAWHHVVVVIKGSYGAGQELYVDGVLATSGTMTVNTNGTTLYLGRCTWDGTYLNGYISKFIVEDKAWTAQEISDYYNLTKGDYGIS